MYPKPYSIYLTGTIGFEDFGFRMGVRFGPHRLGFRGKAMAAS